MGIHDSQHVFLCVSAGNNTGSNSFFAVAWAEIKFIFVLSKKNVKGGPMPTIEEVEKADREQICRWWRFLRSPETDEEVKAMNRIVERFKELGGFTPEISKRLGWG